MTITDHAPRTVHVTQRGNTLVTACEDVEDWTQAQKAWAAEQFRAIVESMPRHPHIEPPAWVNATPDTEGNHDGPSGTVGTIAVSSSWSPLDGPRMWIDALLHDGGDWSTSKARRLAALIVEICDAVDSHATPTNSAASDAAGLRRGGHHPSGPVHPSAAGPEAKSPVGADVEGASAGTVSGVSG